MTEPVNEIPAEGGRFNPAEVRNFHLYDDTDTALDAHHHTLGTGPNQAAAGTHKHKVTDIIGGGTGGGAVEVVQQNDAPNPSIYPDVKLWIDTDEDYPPFGGGSGGGGAQVTVSPNPPSTSSDGDLWAQQSSSGAASDPMPLFVMDNNAWLQVGGSSASVGGGVPVGTITAWAGTTPPTGWQLCDGSAAGSPALAALVGATVPDLRDKFIIGASNTTAVKSTGGAASHQHATPFPLMNGGDAVTALPHNTGVFGVSGTDVTYPNTKPWAANADAAPATGRALLTAGASSLPPYYALAWIIKHTGAAANGLTQDEADARYVNITGDAVTGSLQAPEFVSEWFGAAAKIKVAGSAGSEVLWVTNKAGDAFRALRASGFQGGGGLPVPVHQRHNVTTDANGASFLSAPAGTTRIVSAINGAYEQQTSCVIEGVTYNNRIKTNVPNATLVIDVLWSA